MLKTSQATCFSTTPLPVCPENSYPEELTSKSVGFKCFSKQEAERLNVEARFRAGKSSLGDLAKLGTPTSQKVDLPTKCIEF